MTKPEEGAALRSRRHLDGSPTFQGGHSELAAQGRSALVVSHDLNLAARACDRLVVLPEGVIVASGSPEEVMTAELLAQVYRTEADILTAPDGRPVAVPKGL